MDDFKIYPPIYADINICLLNIHNFLYSHNFLCIQQSSEHIAVKRLVQIFRIIYTSFPGDMFHCIRNNIVLC